MLWFSAPTSLTKDLFNDGKVLEQFHETIHWAFQDVLEIPYCGLNTPRVCFLRAMKRFLEDMRERIGNPEREMLGWERGDRLDLLPGNEDGEIDNEMGPVCPVRFLGDCRLVWPCEFKSKGEVLKKAMTTKKSSGWSSKGWQAHSWWNQTLVSTGSQSSQDQWTREKPQSKRKEISTAMWDLGTMIKNERSTWHKSLKRGEEEPQLAEETKNSR